MKNRELRNAIKESGIKHWQIADALKITEGTFCKMLRYELKPTEREMILQTVSELKQAAEKECE